MKSDDGYGLRDVKVTGNVPKALAARLFGEGPQVDGINRVIGPTTTAVSNPSWDLIHTGWAMGQSGGINKDVSNTILDGVNKMAMKKIQTIATMDPPALPTQISATCDASSGIDVFQAVNLSPSLSVAGGSGVVWAITDVTHKASGTDATTEFKAIARMKT